MKIFWRFFKYLKPYYKPLLLANICMLLFVAFSILSIALVMPFIDLLFNVVPPKPVEIKTFSIFELKEVLTHYFSQMVYRYEKTTLLQFLCVSIVVLFTLKNIFSYLQTYFMAIVENGALRDIRNNLYNHYHNLSLSYFTEERKGDLISRIINDVQILKDSMIAVINSLFRDPPTIIGYSIVLFIFNWKLTLIIFLLAPLTGFILTKIGNSLKRTSIKSQERISEITSILDETLGAIRIVKAFNMENYEKDRFKKYNYNYFRSMVSVARKRALASPISESIGAVSITIILFIIGHDIIQGDSSMTPGGFILYIGIFFQMMPSLKLFGQVFNSINEGIAATTRIFNVLDIKPSVVDKPNAENIKGFKDNISFNCVSFKYEKSDLILNNVSVKINKGQLLAIVGPSGAGKSTMIDLIPRFYDVMEGSITIDEKDIRDFKIESLRKIMGIVNQETILFNDTILNNIKYGKPSASEDEIIEAAKAANAHNFILKSEKGYLSEIGDRGVKLSGGERQRISIARALLKNPPILILDEATSSLDTESEYLVQQAIDRLMEGRTSIVIAHRLSTIQNADKIIVIEKGVVKEEGRHNELLKLNGLYTKLYNIQFKLQELNNESRRLFTD